MEPSGSVPSDAEQVLCLAGVFLPIGYVGFLPYGFVVWVFTALTICKRTSTCCGIPITTSTKRFPTTDGNQAVKLTIIILAIPWTPDFHFFFNMAR